jgi:hypothetical protein
VSAGAASRGDAVDPCSNVESHVPDCADMAVATCVINSALEAESVKARVDHVS